MEAEQEKPRSSGEEQGGGTWECGVQDCACSGLELHFEQQAQSALCWRTLQVSSSGSQYILMASLG